LKFCVLHVFCVFLCVKFILLIFFMNTFRDFDLWHLRLLLLRLRRCVLKKKLCISCVVFCVFVYKMKTSDNAWCFLWKLSEILFYDLWDFCFWEVVERCRVERFKKKRNFVFLLWKYLYYFCVTFCIMYICFLI
jgi:hypothetical protein